MHPGGPRGYPGGSEPIPELNWPSMTMGFPVAPEVKLEGVSKGDTVIFTLTPSGSGQQVTGISKR